MRELDVRTRGDEVKFTFAEQLDNAAKLRKDAQLLLKRTGGKEAVIETVANYPNNQNERVSIQVNENLIKGLNRVIYSRWNDLSYDTHTTDQGEITTPNPEWRQIADGILEDVRDHYHNEGESK